LFIRKPEKCFWGSRTPLVWYVAEGYDTPITKKSISVRVNRESNFTFPIKFRAVIKAIVQREEL
jgi:hypothetical protein